MSFLELTTLIITHGIFDWYLQSREIAMNKSSKFGYLKAHLVILCMGLLVWARLFCELNLTRCFLWVAINVTLHGFIDWYLWRVAKYLKVKQGVDLSNYKYWESKSWYDFIMLDQTLHGLCYIGTYFLLK